MKKKTLLLTGLASVSIALAGCGESTTTQQQTQASETQQKVENSVPDHKPTEGQERNTITTEDSKPIDTSSEKTASNKLLEEFQKAGLSVTNPKDVTEKYKAAEGLVKAIKIDEALIYEFKDASFTKKYDNPKMNSFSYKNLNILIMPKVEDQKEEYVKALKKL
ncbi:hypothetical protein [Aneurinibacillus aneurinilyticus]|uniref:hypothetical protein n=1 Tax=Aneurinibacillus aneurinilyticus TaxID=1391 RepID=UPI0035251F1F